MFPWDAHLLDLCVFQIVFVFVIVFHIVLREHGPEISAILRTECMEKAEFQEAKLV